MTAERRRAAGEVRRTAGAVAEGAAAAAPVRRAAEAVPRIAVEARLGAAQVGATALAAALATVVWLLSTGAVLAADPTATPGAGGDPRSAGEGPGFVGQPLLAIGLVAAVGVVAALATWLYVRTTGGRHHDRPGPPSDRLEGRR